MERQTDTYGEIDRQGWRDMHPFMEKQTGQGWIYGEADRQTGIGERHIYMDGETERQL